MFNNINLSKHRILNKINDVINATDGEHGQPIKSNVLFELLNNKEKNNFTRAINYLATDGYLRQVRTNYKNIADIYITEKGIAAATGDYFKIKFWRKVSFIIRDVFTVIVGIATIITLILGVIKDDGIKHTQEDIELLRQELHRQQKLLDNIKPQGLLILDTLKVSIVKPAASNPPTSNQ